MSKDQDIVMTISLMVFQNLIEIGFVCNNKQKNEKGTILRMEEKPVSLYKELIER